MSRYNFEFKMDIEEHVPIAIQAEGRDMESLLANAEYCVDVPDPVKYHSIDNLSARTYCIVQGRFAELMAEQDEARAEFCEAMREL